MGNYSFRDSACKKCGGTIYYKNNLLCVKCNPNNREVKAAIKIKQRIRRRIEEHQRLIDVMQ